LRFKAMAKVASFVEAVPLVGRLATARPQAPTADGSLNRQVLNLAWPSLVENLLQTMLGVVDLLMVGRLGADAIAGVGLANQVMNLLVVTFAGLAVGNTALVARSVGAGQKAEAERIAASDPVMWVDIAKGNRLRILAALDAYIARLSRLRSDFNKGRFARIAADLRRAKTFRESL